jgi:hypothetical protein
VIRYGQFQVNVNPWQHAQKKQDKILIYNNKADDREMDPKLISGILFENPEEEKLVGEKPEKR